jgi:hypothetical protein
MKHKRAVFGAELINYCFSWIGNGDSWYWHNDLVLMEKAVITDRPDFA